MAIATAVAKEALKSVSTPAICDIGVGSRADVPGLVAGLLGQIELVDWVHAQRPSVELKFLPHSESLYQQAFLGGATQVVFGGSRAGKSAIIEIGRAFFLGKAGKGSFKSVVRVSVQRAPASQTIRCCFDLM